MAMVTKTEIRKVVSQADMRISGDFWDALDMKVKGLLKDAIMRAKGNGRKTLKDYDL